MKILHLRWYIAAMLFTATVINYIDRQTLSIVAPVLTRELHISLLQYGFILQGFLIAYTIMYLGSGFLVDRWGSRISLAVFMAWWSVSNMLHMFARTAFGLGIFRVLLGLGEPGNFIGSFKVTSEWYPPKERAFINGLVNAGAAVGAIISAPLVVWITIHYGWRASFAATGVLGLFWLVPWLWLYRLPEKHPYIEPAEFNYIRVQDSAASQTASGVSKRCLLRAPQTWGLLLAKFISEPVWWFYLFWLPKYLVDQRGFSIVEIGMLAWLPYLCADLGSIAGGVLSGALVKRGWNVLRARSSVMLPFAMLMPLSIVIAYTPSRFMAVVLICIVTFSHMAWKTNLMTINNDIYPVQVVGSVSGLIAFGSGLGGTLFTGLTGYIVQNFSYALIFIIMGFLHPMAYLVVKLLVRGPIPSDTAAPSQLTLSNSGVEAR
jgi:ACS family hexuronate transporter-like MFS transporter